MGLRRMEVVGFLVGVEEGQLAEWKSQQVEDTESYEVELFQL